MNLHLAPKMPRYSVANLRNSLLLRAIRALYRNILNRNLLRPDVIRGSLDTDVGRAVLCPMV